MPTSRKVNKNVSGCFVLTGSRFFILIEAIYKVLRFSVQNILTILKCFGFYMLNDVELGVDV